MKKTAIVTGASRGIGRAISLKLAADGFIVIAAARADEEKAADYIAELKAISPESIYVPTDISKKEDRIRLIDTAYDTFGTLDVLVNNDSPSADRGLVNESLNKEIERALSTLATREREIIKSFFGIGCQEMTLEEIGERFGLTRERVRQIKEKAIRKLKNNSRSKLLKGYLG